MSRSSIYDNWERLVAATVKREQVRQLCHAHSREPSISSSSSGFSTLSPFPSARWSTHDTNSLYAVPSETLSPEEIFVNGEPLSQKALNVLLSCRHPPRKLMPGRFWYDKATGFWGKQGHKPSQIISPLLNVAGPLPFDASNGDVQIFINGRQITKAELRMLKFANVPCWPNTNFWMYENGMHQYEGQSNIFSSIWDKVGMKLICSFLSLPFPPKFSQTGVEDVPQNLDQNAISKLLLIGVKGSGTSAIFNKAVESLKLDNKPSKVETGHVASSIELSCVDFTLPEFDANNGNLHDSLLRFQLIKLKVKDSGENSTWLPMLEDVQIVLFCVTLSDYDELYVDRNGITVNKMLYCKNFLENMITHPRLDQTDFLLLFNKFDLFEEKIAKVGLSKCSWFDDFDPVRSTLNSNNAEKTTTLGQLGFHYVALKFKRFYSSLKGRKLYASLVESLEPHSVHAALMYAREILKWDRERRDNDLSGYSSSSSTDSSSSSDSD